MTCTDARMHECTDVRTQETTKAAPRTLGACIVAVVHLCVLMNVNVLNAQTREWPSERPPRSLPARDIKFPPYEIQTLPNGLQVIAVLHHEQPAVTMRLLVLYDDYYKTATISYQGGERYPHLVAVEGKPDTLDELAKALAK